MTVKIKKGSALAALSLTPLIDVVFLLLIFFLVATRFAKEEYELDVQVPSASEAQPLTATPKEIYVNINNKGDYYVEGKFIGIDELERILKNARTNNPANQSVIIRADKQVQLQPVVDVINICNRVGIVDHRLTTEGPGG